MKRFDGIEMRGLSGRVIAEEDTDRDRKEEAAGYRDRRYHCGPMGNDGDQLRSNDAEDDSGHPAGDAQEHRFDQEL